MSDSEVPGAALVNAAETSSATTTTTTSSASTTSAAAAESSSPSSSSVLGKRSRDADSSAEDADNHHTSSTADASTSKRKKMVVPASARAAFAARLKADGTQFEDETGARITLSDADEASGGEAYVTISADNDAQVSDAEALVRKLLEESGAAASAATATDSTTTTTSAAPAATPADHSAAHTTTTSAPASTAGGGFNPALYPNALLPSQASASAPAAVAPSAAAAAYMGGYPAAMAPVASTLAPGTLPSPAVIFAAAGIVQGPADPAGMSETLLAPNEKVGLIIGRAGANIKQIELLSGVRVQVAPPIPGSNDPRVVTLYGSAEQRVVAVAEISRILATGGPRPLVIPGMTPAAVPAAAGAGAGAAMPYAGIGYPAAAAAAATLSSSSMLGDQLVEKVRIPNHVVGLFIGRAGESIRLMQLRSGCSVQVAREPGTEFLPEREITLMGSPAQVQAARREIDAFLLANANAPVVPGGSAPEQPLMQTHVAVVRVPNAAVGSVIGRGGETIKRLQQMTGARIQIDKQDNGVEREVTITGGAHEVERAKHEINELLLQKQMTGGLVQYMGPGQGAAVMGGGVGGGGYGAGGAFGGGAGGAYGGYPGAAAAAYGAYGAYGAAAAAAYMDPYGRSMYDYQQQQQQQQQHVQQQQQQQQQGAAKPNGGVSFPPPPTDPAQFDAYWSKLTEEQQNAYRAQYYAQQS